MLQECVQQSKWRMEETKFKNNNGAGVRIDSSTVVKEPVFNAE